MDRLTIQLKAKLFSIKGIVTYVAAGPWVHVPPVIYSAVNYATVLATAPETSQSQTFLADLIFNGLQWLRAGYQQKKAGMFRQDAQGGVPEAGKVVVVGLAMYIVGKYMNY